ncbi:ParA family protein [Treponema sp. Marseille-Q3903]|uniref:ParA family protein n=1 Tax=Treponema sp. Marseille-Q3903 TaxID=2766703 RepID=UPI001651B814|nr:AAA family ATPase [Treponema sp. Marseille-Q3903]MBC6712422.1 AAA family ATPase [Treponema sp. Marseille-Q3903]
MKTIAVVQRKGGNRKSTSCLNLARCLSLKGKKVLIVDLDDQKNSTQSILFENKIVHTVDEVLVNDELFVKDAFTATDWEGVKVIAGSSNFSGVIRELDGEVGSHLVLKEKLDEVKVDFDFCLVDTSPSLNILVVNALCAADFAFIPLSSKYFSLQGLGQSLESISKVKKRLSPDLKILGIAFVIYDARASLSKEVVSKASEEYKDYVLKSVVNQNVRIEEAQTARMTIFDYKSTDNGAVQYEALCEEILSIMEA